MVLTVNNNKISKCLSTITLAPRKIVLTSGNMLDLLECTDSSHRREDEPSIHCNPFLNRKEPESQEKVLHLYLPLPEGSVIFLYTIL